jgi:hypothetical protein
VLPVFSPKRANMLSFDEICTSLRNVALCRFVVTGAVRMKLLAAPARLGSGYRSVTALPTGLNNEAGIVLSGNAVRTNAAPLWTVVFGSKIGVVNAPFLAAGSGTVEISTVSCRVPVR